MDREELFEQLLLECKLLNIDPIYFINDKDNIIRNSIWDVKNYRSNSDYLDILPKTLDLLVETINIKARTLETSIKFPHGVIILKNLKKLHITGYKLDTIPDNIGEMENLQDLSFRDCNNIRSVSHNIGHLRKLKRLDLCRTRMNSVPNFILYMPMLEVLNLDNNNIEEIPDQIDNLKNLTELNLGMNPIAYLPDSFSNLNKLTDLNLTLDPIIEHLPDNFGDLINLRTIKLNNIENIRHQLKNVWARNKLRNLPASFAKLGQLKELDIYALKIKELPDDIGNLTNLVSLRVEKTYLESLPDSLFDLKKLRHLDIKENFLECDHMRLSGLVSLETIWIKFEKPSKLSKDILSNIGNLRHLRKLSIDGGNFTISESIGKLTNLEQLYLTTGSLTNVPDSIGDLENLKELGLSGNNLVSLPDSICNLTKLETLFVNNNKLSGLPDDFSKMYPNLLRFYSDFDDDPNSLHKINFPDKWIINKEKGIELIF